MPLRLRSVCDRLPPLVHGSLQGGKVVTSEIEDTLGFFSSSPAPASSINKTVQPQVPPLQAGTFDNTMQGQTIPAVQADTFDDTMTPPQRRSLVDIMTFGIVADASRKKPWGLSWRSSPWFITCVVTLGVATDLLTHTIVVPIAPYRLETLGYSDVSSLTSWLLVAYSGGIAVLTPFIGYYFHLLPWRRGPLLFSIILMQGALIFFMLVKPFWAMVLARVVLGGSSAIIWSIGLVLIVENVDEKNIGRQLGFATAGVSIGSTIGPPIGGALYDAMGWHAPFIFCIIICSIDFVGRMLIVEQKDAILWLDKPSSALPGEMARAEKREEASLDKATKRLSPLGVLAKLGKAPRGLASIAVVAAFSLTIGLQEPTITIHTKETWNKDSHFVGLIYLAAALPTFFVGPIAGELADRFGSEWIVLPGLLFALPWMPLLIFDKILPAFIVFFALGTIGISVMAAPVGLELAMTAKSQEGISEIHQFAAMNFSFAIFAAVGPIIGGQLYDYVDGGFTIACWLMFAIIAMVGIPAFCFTGNRPLLARLRRQKNKQSHHVAEEDVTTTHSEAKGS